MKQLTPLLLFAAMGLNSILCAGGELPDGAAGFQAPSENLGVAEESAAACPGPYPDGMELCSGLRDGFLHLRGRKTLDPAASRDRIHGLLKFSKVIALSESQISRVLSLR